MLISFLLSRISGLILQSQMHQTHMQLRCIKSASHVFSWVFLVCSAKLTALRFCERQAIAEVCAVCNEARIECKEGVFKAAGAPTEAALVVLAEKLGVPHAHQSAAIAAARQSDPDANADGVQRWYNAK